MGVCQIAALSTTYTTILACKKCFLLKPKKRNKIRPTLRPAKNSGTPNPSTAISVQKSQ